MNQKNLIQKNSGKIGKTNMEKPTFEIWRDGSGKFRAVCTAGIGPIHKIGSTASFIHDQSGRYIFDGEMVDWVEVSGTMNLGDLYGKSILGYTYK